MLDITKLLHTVIDLELAIDDSQELMIGPQTRQQTIYLHLDQALSKFADAAGWANVLTKEHQSHVDVTKCYVRVLALFLLFSVKRQWTHLIVISDEEWQRITNAEAKDKLADLNKEYLAVKNFLNASFYSRRQDDFRHAWHLILKMGIIDFQIKPAEIMDAYQQMANQLTKQFVK